MATDLTPEQDGANLTQGDGTDQNPGSNTNPELDASPAQVDYETKFKESSKEAQRLYQENQQLKQQTQQFQNYWNQFQMQQQNKPEPQPTAPATPVDTLNVLSPEEAADMNQAWLNGDSNKISHYSNLQAQRTLEYSQKQQEQLMRTQQEKQLAVTTLQQLGQELNNQSSPLYQKTMEKYQQLSNSSRSQLWKDTTVTHGGLTYNLNGLREAVLEAKAELGASRNVAQAQVQQDEFIPVEPSQRGPAPPGQIKESTGFNPQVHLTEAERLMANKLSQRDDKYKENPYKTYWESLEKTYPGLQKARLKKGEPVTAFQAGLRNSP